MTGVAFVPPHDREDQAMRTKLSTKGRIVSPSSVRRKLSLRPGEFEIEVRGVQVILTPPKKRSAKARIVTDPVTGLPVLTVGPDALQFTSNLVLEILDEFP